MADHWGFASGEPVNLRSNLCGVNRDTDFFVENLKKGGKSSCKNFGQPEKMVVLI